jgi:hypothetical protein
MSIKEELFTSFIKGVGRTSGTVTILGVLGYMWYCYTKSNETYISEVDVEENETPDITLQDIDEHLQEDTQEEDNIQEDNTDDEEEPFQQERNYRKIFDRI